jgi:putative SOS response-associated peptidase YedK
MLKPYPAAEMETVQVRQTVNKVQNEGPELVEPAA